MSALPVPGRIPVTRVLGAPTPGAIVVRRGIATIPARGSLPGGPMVLPPALPGRIQVDRPLKELPTAGRIWAGARSPLPTPGHAHPDAFRPPGRHVIGVARVRGGLPRPGSLTAEAQDDRAVGATGLGTISVADPVIARIAARAVLDVPDAGGVAPGVIGKLAGGHLGVRETSLDSIPKTTASVDGTRAFVTTVVSVRWPAPIASTAQAVRDSIRAQVGHMVGVEVPEVEVRVEALIERTDTGPRVR